MLCQGNSRGHCLIGGSAERRSVPVVGPAVCPAVFAMLQVGLGQPLVGVLVHQLDLETSLAELEALPGGLMTLRVLFGERLVEAAVSRVGLASQADYEGQQQARHQQERRGFHSLRPRQVGLGWGDYGHAVGWEYRLA